MKSFRQNDANGLPVRCGRFSNELDQISKCLCHFEIVFIRYRLLPAKGLVFLFRVKRRALLGCKITVAVDDRFRVFGAKEFEQKQHRCFLRIRACVLCFLHILCLAAYIANTDAVGIVPGAVRARCLDRSSRLDCAVQINYIVIADVTPAALFSMPATDVVSAVVTPLRCVRAVNDNLFNISHILLYLVCCGSGDRTRDLEDMNLTCYHCTIPRYKKPRPCNCAFACSIKGARLILRLGCSIQ